MLAVDYGGWESGEGERDILRGYWRDARETVVEALADGIAAAIRHGHILRPHRVWQREEKKEEKG